MDELQHSGIKGMHWGHHKNVEKQDAKWQAREIKNPRHYMNAHNNSLDEMNKFLDHLNTKFNGGKGLNTSEHSSKWNARTKLYVKTYDTKYQNVLNRHLHTIVSPSGNYHLSANVKNGEVQLTTKKKNN